MRVSCPLFARCAGTPASELWCSCFRAEAAKPAKEATEKPAKQAGKKRAAAVFLVVGALLQFAEGALHEAGTGHADRGALDFVFQPEKHGLGGGFAGLEDDIAGETVAKDDFDRILEEVVALDVAAEVESARPEEFKNFFGELAALGIFAADRHQSDGRVLVAENVAREDGSHDGVL